MARIRVPIRISDTYHTTLQNEAQQDNRSLNNYLIDLIEEARRIRRAIQNETPNPATLMGIAETPTKQTP